MITIQWRTGKQWHRPYYIKGIMTNGGRPSLAVSDEPTDPAPGTTVEQVRAILAYLIEPEGQFTGYRVRQNSFIEEVA